MITIYSGLQQRISFLRINVLLSQIPDSTNICICTGKSSCTRKSIHELGGFRYFSRDLFVRRNIKQAVVPYRLDLFSFGFFCIHRFVWFSIDVSLLDWKMGWTRGRDPENLCFQGEALNVTSVILSRLIEPPDIWLIACRHDDDIDDTLTLTLIIH